MLKPQNRRNLIAVFITVLIIAEMVAYVITTPRPQEQFFQVYVLGSNRLAADYYPNNDSNIRPGDQVNWYLGVTNSMGSVQLVAIHIKLGNQSTNPPNDQQATPSPAPAITEFTRFLLNNETWEFPLVWQITKTSTAAGSTSILELQMNNQTIQLQGVQAVHGYNFRVIIELWTWQADASAFQFGWFSGTDHRVAWLQVWFNATSVR